MKINKYVLPVFVASMMPFVALADDAIDIALSLVNRGIILLIAVATVVFLYGVIQYVIAKGDEKALQAGKTYMLYGIIGLTVMVAAWGFVALIQITIFDTTMVGGPDSIPQI